VETGIPPGVWADEGIRGITTAVAVLDERAKQIKGGKAKKPMASG
jgi:hypothetical protein